MAKDLLGDVIPQAWLPDETLFSLCSRHHALSRNHRSATSCQQLFGHGSQGAAHDLPSRIGNFVEVTRGLLGDVDSIIRQRTVLPFYLPFASRVNEAEVFAAMAGTSIGGLKFQLGLLTSRFRANHPLKACIDCMAEDKGRWSTSYWRVQHQLPGVWVCLMHGRPLSQSSLKATGVGRLQWLLPDPSHLVQIDVGAKEARTLVELAGSVIRLWSLPKETKLDPLDVSSTHWRALCRRGFARGAELRQLSHTMVGREYAAHLLPLRNVKELEALPATPDAAAKEVARLAHQPRSGQHPLRQLALINWLYGDLDEFLVSLSEQSHAEKSDQNSKERSDTYPALTARSEQLSRLVESGLSVTAASRELGVDPHTGMAWMTKRGLVAPKRPSRMRDEVRARMIAALRRGDSKAAVADLGGVSIESVTRLLDTEIGLREEWSAARFAAKQSRSRHVWRELVAANPASGVKAVRLLRPEIYAWLYRNDRDWLAAQKAVVSAPHRVIGPRVDWVGRDRELAQSVTQAAMELARDRPGQRLKLWQIYQRLPDLKAKLGHLDKLPQTHMALKTALSANTQADGDLAWK